MVNYYTCPMYGLNGSYGTAIFSWIFALLLIGLSAAGIYYIIKSAGGRR